MRRLAVLAVLYVVFAGWVVATMAANSAPTALPSGFTVPADFHEDPTHRQYWAFDSVQYDYLPAAAKAMMTHQKVEGHLWHVAVSTTAVPLNNPDGVITRLADAFQADGWTILRRQGTLVAQKPADGSGLWVSGTGNAGYFSLVLTQVAAPSRSLTLPSPQAQPETVKDNQNLPYALPLPGSKMEKTQIDHRSFEVTLPNSNQPLLLVPDETRWYDEPSGVSSYEFAAVYGTALAAAGWDIVLSKVGGDAVVIAHYAKNGRDVWLYTRGDGGKQNIDVVDYGAQSKAASLKQQLAKEGHVALYGIYFDTDSAVPRPESEATLQNVLQLLKDSTLTLEVQGHTDNTGAPDHNATLSEARAASVTQWLTAHGIAGARLTSRGYGATMPVADNQTEEGRAKNRRVELANVGASATADPEATPAPAAGATAAATGKGADLACRLGVESGTDQTVAVGNSTSQTLKAETIINIGVAWKSHGTPGGTDDCFAIDHALPVNATVSHGVSVQDGAVGESCTAYLSSLHPTVVHQSGGGDLTECDPR